MLHDPAENLPAFLTTREVAALLRVKERKVYDLAAAGQIPCRRLTGKLLFPRDEIRAWIDGSAAEAGPDRPAVLTGSHDPLLDWAARQSDSGLAILLNGSAEGLRSFADGRAMLAGMHIPEADGWNVDAVARAGLRNCVLLTWAVRSRGLVLADGVRDSVQRVSDLRGKRVALRQPGAGATALLEALLEREGIALEELTTPAEVARTEADAAAAVATGEADAAMAIEAMAHRFGVGFLPLVEERFDLLIDRRAYFGEPVQRLLAFARSAKFGEKARSMGGYDLDEAGTVRWVSP